MTTKDFDDQLPADPSTWTDEHVEWLEDEGLEDDELERRLVEWGAQLVAAGVWTPEACSTACYEHKGTRPFFGVCVVEAAALPTVDWVTFFDWCDAICDDWRSRTFRAEYQPGGIAEAAREGIVKFRAQMDQASGADAAALAARVDVCAPLLAACTVAPRSGVLKLRASLVELFEKAGAHDGEDWSDKIETAEEWSPDVSNMVLGCG